MPKKTDKGQEHTKTDPGIARKGDFVVVKRQMRIDYSAKPGVETHGERYMVLRVLKADRKGIAQNFAEQHEWNMKHAASTGNTRAAKDIFRVYTIGEYGKRTELNALMDKPFETLDEMRAEIRQVLGIEVDGGEAA